MSSESHGQVLPAAREAGREVSSDLLKAKLIFVGAALLSLLVSVYLFFLGDREQGIFVGLWVPSILAAGALTVTGGRHE